MSIATTKSVRSVRKSTYLFGALGGLPFGYDTGIVAGALLFITPEMHLSSLQSGMVSSSLLVGAAIGALASGQVTDRIGRRAVVQLAAVLFGAGAIGAAIAPSFSVVLAFRFIMGLGVGGSSTTVPVYLSEIAPRRNRGALSGLNQLLISTGVLLAYVVNLAMTPSHGWRWMFALGAVPAVLLLAGAYFQPESPRWLMKKGREQESRAVLSHSREPEELDAELKEIARINEAERARMGFRELYRDRRLRAILMVGVGVAFLQQMVGINTIIYYAPTILKKIGFGTSAAILANAGLGVLTVVVTAIMVVFVVDRVGRRKPLIYGAIGMATAMATLAIVFYTTGLKGGAAGWIAIAALALFKISFSLSWGGIAWIILGEIFPLRARGTAMGIATAASWAGNFLVGQFFPVLLGVGEGLVFVIFSLLGLTACWFAIRKVPETKGKSLEQLEEELASSPARAGHTAQRADHISP